MRALFISYFLFELMQRVLSENGTCPKGPIQCPNTPYRSIDGSCNNLDVPHLGMAFRPYRRVTRNRYSDGKYAVPVTSSGKPFPSARVVSNVLFPEGTPTDKRFTLTLMQMGQLLTHDMSLAADTIPNGRPPPSNCCVNRTLGTDSTTDKCFDITIPKNDIIYGEAGYQCQGFARSGTTKKYGCMEGDVQEQISVVTSFFDLSIIYGSSNQRNQYLREFSGGRLTVEKRYNKFWPKKAPSLCLGARPNEETCYFSGDDRLNQNPQLTILHILFINEHNRIAGKLAKINPHWDDEKLFQEARRINTAQYQHILYYEVLPGYMGFKNMVDYGLIYPRARSCVDDYDKRADPSIIQEFATGVWRKFHTLVLGTLRMFDGKHKPTGTLDMSDWLNRQVLEVNATDQYTIFDELLNGLTTQKQDKSDDFYDPIMKFKFFKNARGLGVDVVAIDIQRHRDHGLGRYLDVRRYCGLYVPSDWTGMSKLMPNDSVKKLRQLYEKLDDIELYSGANLEPPIKGALGGPTVQCIVLKQFKNLRVADRFFYENCELTRFTKEQLNSIRRISLAKVICDNTEVNKIQRRVTEEIGRRNPIVKCRYLPRVNLSLWSDYKNYY